MHDSYLGKYDPNETRRTKVYKGRYIYQFFTDNDKMPMMANHLGQFSSFVSQDHEMMYICIVV